jgi:hypothetical protein
LNSLPLAARDIHFLFFLSELCRYLWVPYPPRRPRHRFPL